MRVAVLSAGSRGDVQPYLALAVALNRAGHQARLIAPQNFAPLAAEYGVELAPLRADLQAIMAGGAAGRKLMRGGSNPFAMLGAMRDMIAPLMDLLFEDVWAGTEGSDALVAASATTPFAYLVTEVRHIPIINSTPVPLIPTRDHPAPVGPQFSLGRFYNGLTHLFVLQIYWQLMGPLINKARARFGLQPMTRENYLEIFRKVPTLGAYSEAVYPRPSDYTPNVTITGYWFLDTPAYAPPDALRDFLAGGPPPVYIGFGSMSNEDPEATTRIVLDAVQKAGVRAVLSSGWGGLRATDVPASVCVIGDAPHDWLFPRMAAVVHHGGAGTTAAGLRAGVPTIIVPHIADQPFWGRLVAKLGAGTPPILQRRLTADGLAAALRRATQDAGMRARAASLGERIRAEDGVGTAVRLIEGFSRA